MKFTLRKEPDQENKFDLSSIEMKFEVESLQDFFSELECFLRACGYSIPMDSIDLIEEDHLEFEDKFAEPLKPSEEKLETASTSFHSMLNKQPSDEFYESIEDSSDIDLGQDDEDDDDVLNYDLSKDHNE